MRLILITILVLALVAFAVAAHVSLMSTNAQEPHMPGMGVRQ